MMRRPVVGTVLLAAALAAGLALVGCSADPQSPASGPEASSSQAATTPAESASPAPSDSPSVAAASGPQLQVERISATAPTGWQEVEVTVSDGFAVAGDSDTRLNFITLLSRPHLYDAPASTGELARGVLYGESPKARRLPDVEVDGRTLYHVVGVGRDPANYHYERFGLDDGGLSLSIDFELEKSRWRQEPDLVDSVLATVAIG